MADVARGSYRHVVLGVTTDMAGRVWITLNQARCKTRAGWSGQIPGPIRRVVHGARAKTGAVFFEAQP